MNGVLITGNIDKVTNHVKMEDWHNVSISKGCQRLLENHQMLGRGKEGFPTVFRRNKAILID